MEHRPLDIVEMGTTDYDITHYQPVLYRAESIEEVVDVVGGFFSTCTDESIEEMRMRSEATVKDRDGPIGTGVVRDDHRCDQPVEHSATQLGRPDAAERHRPRRAVGRQRRARRRTSCRRAFGFDEVAYTGLETGSRDRTSHVLEQGRVRLVVTGTLRSGTRSPRTTRATATASR